MMVTDTFWFNKQLGPEYDHPFVCPNCGENMDKRGWQFIDECNGICKACESHYNRCSNRVDVDY